MSGITPKLNLSLPPRRINGVPLNIFNDDTDFKNDDDVRFVNAEGDVMTGALTVPSLVISGTQTLNVPSITTSGTATAENYVCNDTISAQKYIVGSSPDGVMNRFYSNNYGFEIVGSGSTFGTRPIFMWDKVGIFTTAVTAGNNFDVNGNAMIRGTLQATNVNVNTITTNYTTLPTFTSSQVGYIVSSFNAAGANTTGSLQNLASVAVNAGVWLVKWNFTVMANSGSVSVTSKIIGVGIASTTILADSSKNDTVPETINTTNLIPTYQGTYFLTTANASSTIYLIINISQVIKCYNINLSALRIA